MADIQPRVVTKEETVAGQMEGLLGKESPLMTMSRTKAAETANMRGMLSSTMAVQAGEAAAIQSALPIAQQDAQIYAQSGQSSQEAAQEIASTTHKGEVSGGLITKEYGLKSELSGQEAAQQKELSTQQAGEKAALSTQEATQAQTLAAQQKDYTLAIDTNKSQWDMQIRQMMETNSFNIATMQDLGNTTRTNIEAANRALLTAVEVDSAERQAVIGLSKDLGQQFQVTLNNIAVSDLNANAKTMALNNAYNSYVSLMTTGAKLAGLNISWSSPSISFEVPAAAAPAAAPAAPFMKQEISELWEDYRRRQEVTA